MAYSTESSFCGDDGAAEGYYCFSPNLHDSEALWVKLLPSDYKKILSRAVDQKCTLDHHFTCKKEIYFRLHQPLLIDHGTKSFALDMATGNKSFMLSAQMLDIVWKNDPRYWRMVQHADSRFSEVAELLLVWWFDIIGRISSSELTRGITYACYLVYKLTEDSDGLTNIPLKRSITVGNGDPVKSIIHLNPSFNMSAGDRHPTGILERLLPPRSPSQTGDLPAARPDGWMEICLGEFSNNFLVDTQVRMSLSETVMLKSKRGMIVEGIEVRPKNKSSS